LHESGAQPAQELGITFAIACRYADELVSRGLDFDTFAPRISFFFGMGLKLFEEAAKFRAARRLWAHLVRQRYGTNLPASEKLRVTSVAPCGSHFSAYEPELNLVRGTLGVLAGALGGVQAMLGTTIDEAYDIPTERTQRLALRTQQIVSLESDVRATVDPLGGSYFVEAMTDAIEERARLEMDRVGGPDGVVQAILDGRPQNDLAARAYTMAQEEADGVRPRVGDNIFRSGEHVELQLHQADPTLHETRARELAELRARRDNGAVREALDEVRDTARGDKNVMPSLIRAVEVYATVGEISAALDDVFGRHREAVAL
jgi:methylmalonyl-CoA mutase N-terminal domain/subunit